MKYKLLIILISLGFLSTSCNPECDQPFPEGKHLINTDEAGHSIAMEGYDIVAIYNTKKLIKGSQEFTSKINGVNYHFSSDVNKKMFDNNPEKYQPQFGGFCAVAASFGNAEELTTYDLFDLKDGKLYFSKSERAHKMWKKDPQKIIDKATNRWNCIVSENGVAISDTYSEPSNIK